MFLKDHQYRHRTGKIASLVLAKQFTPDGLSLDPSWIAFCAMTKLKLWCDTIDDEVFGLWNFGPITGSVSNGRWIVMHTDGHQLIGSVSNYDDEAFRADFEPHDEGALVDALFDANVQAVAYHNPALEPTLTIAIVRLTNGFVVVDFDIPQDRMAFDAELGRRYALERAMAQLVPLNVFAAAVLREKGA